MRAATAGGHFSRTDVYGMLPKMRDSSHRERILEALRISSRPLDDDQLSERAGVRPRQSVNMKCRSLELEGLVRRYVGVDGKIVNELRRDGNAEPQIEDARPSDAPSGGASAHEGAAVDLDTGGSPAGSSVEQREAERVMLDLLAAEIGQPLEPARIAVPSGARVEVDGSTADRSVLVECWAHQGSPKSAQRHKVLADAFKLTWISTTIYPRPRLILCLADPAAAAPFLPTSRSWPAQALQDRGVTVVLVELPDDLRHRVRQAQKRQHR